MEGFKGRREEKGSAEKKRTGGASASAVVGRDGRRHDEICVEALAVAGRCLGLRGDRLGLGRVDEIFGSSCQGDVGE